MELEQLELQVQFIPGEDIVLGRDSRLERRELLILSLRSTPERALVDKELLVRWMEYAYVSFVKPMNDVVNVYSLQESSSDWVPAPGRKRERSSFFLLFLWLRSGSSNV